MPMDKTKRASWARALFGQDDEQGGEVLEGAGRMPSVPSNNSAQAQQLMQRQSAAQEAKALDEQLPKDQAAAWQEPAPIPTKEGWDAVPLDITKDLEEVWGKPTPTGTSQASGQAPEAVATPGDGWKGKQQTDAWVGGGGWSYARIQTQDGEIIQATNPKSGKVVEVKPGMKNADGMDLFTLIDTERQNQLSAGATAPTDEMKRQASAEIASVTPSKGDMEKAMSMGKGKPAAKPKPKPVLGQEDMDFLFGNGAPAPALVRGEQALSEPDQLSSLAERGISQAMGGAAPTSQPVSIELNGKSYQVDQIGTMQESLNPFVKGITAVDPLTGLSITLQPGTPEFKQAVAALSNQTYSPPLPAGTAQAKPGATGNVFQVDGKSVIVVGGGTDPLNPGLKAPLMVLDQQTGQAIPQNSPAYAKAIQMAGVK